MQDSLNNTELHPRRFTLGDIMNYYQKGQALTQAGAWNIAIDTYQKALTYIPRILGVQEWFQQYLLNGYTPAQIADDQVADIYAQLGRCYLAMGKWDEAHLYVTAALKWHQTNRTATSIINTYPRIAEVPSALPAMPDPSGIHRPPIDPNNITEFTRDRLTLIIITHNTNKLQHYKELAPPSVKLISATYGSMLNVFNNAPAVCQKFVCYDRPPEHSRDGDAYQNGLDQFCRQQSFEFVVSDAKGLRHILQTILPRVTTPYVWIVEHDWLFSGSKIQLADLLLFFDDNPAANSIRFNQRSNTIERYDFLMETERAGRIPLLKTVAHSNNPSIMRTAKLRDEWLPLCLSDTYYGTKDVRATAYGVEEPLLKKHIEDVRDSSFQIAHENWGAYLFGNIGDAARILHLGQ